MDVRITDGDLYLLNGDVQFVRGGEAIRQNLETRARCFYGENAYDPTMGVPWLQVVFGRDASTSEIKLAIEATLRTVRGVDSVAVTSCQIENGVATVQGVATTDGREVNFTIERISP